MLHRLYRGVLLAFQGLAAHYSVIESQPGDKPDHDNGRRVPSLLRLFLGDGLRKHL